MLSNEQIESTAKEISNLIYNNAKIRIDNTPIWDANIALDVSQLGPGITKNDIQKINGLSAYYSVDLPENEGIFYNRFSDTLHDVIIEFFGCEITGIELEGDILYVDAAGSVALKATKEGKDLNRWFTHAPTEIEGERTC